jgi:hypothetical protein
MSVFKYTDAKGIGILKDLRIKVSNATKLNDPFELAPLIDQSKFKVEKLLRFNRHIDAAYDKEGRRNGFTNKKAFKRWYLQTLPKRIANVRAKLPQNVSELKEDFAGIFSEHFRLFCASKTERSILMWSHYAEKHAGLVFEIDDSTQPFSRLGSEYRIEVDYKPQREEYLHDHKNLADTANIIAIARRKSPEWHYEQEVRFVILAEVCPNDFYRIVPASIQRVILGMRADGDLQRSVTAELQRPEFAHVVLQRAKPSENEFALEFGTINGRST